jgi:hypothetical protein
MNLTSIRKFLLILTAISILIFAGLFLNINQNASDNSIDITEKTKPTQESQTDELVIRLKTLKIPTQNSNKSVNTEKRVFNRPFHHDLLKNKADEEAKRKENVIMELRDNFLNSIEKNKPDQGEEALIKEFDLNCDNKKQREWESIDSLVFFKRNAAFYFFDANLIRLHLLANSFALDKLAKMKFRITTKMIIQNREVNLIFKNISLSIKSKVDEYAYLTADADFNFNQSKIGVIFDEENFRFQVKICIEKKKCTKSKLSLKIKYLLPNGRKPSKKTVLICAKCLNQKDESFESVNAWLDLSKKIGYDKIILYDHSNFLLGNESRFRQFYDENFLQLEKLECIPNLDISNSKKKQKYFKNFSRSKKLNLLSDLIQNECFSNNYDIFNYIAVFSIGETLFLPQKTTNRQNNSTKKCESTNLASFLSDLKKTIQSNIEKPVSFFFKTVPYIDSKITEDFFLKARDLIIQNQSTDFPIKIKSSLKPKISFVISSEQEFSHMKNLYNSHSKIVTDHSQIFKNNYRLFYINCKNNSASIFESHGRTIHDTRRSFDIDSNYQLSYLNGVTNNIFKKLNGTESSNVNDFMSIDLNHAFVSSFNSDLDSKNRISVPVSYLFFDSNYFNCYLK